MLRRRRGQVIGDRWSGLALGRAGFVGASRCSGFIGSDVWFCRRRRLVGADGASKALDLLAARVS